MFSALPALLLSVPRQRLETFTGNMLGDGSILYPNFSRDKRITGNARYAMTMKASSLSYITSLITKVYSQYNATKPNPYPNVKLAHHIGKSITQYSFQTARSPIFSAIHAL
jgi:hypothetical protein